MMGEVWRQEAVGTRWSEKVLDGVASYGAEESGKRRYQTMIEQHLAWSH